MVTILDMATIHSLLGLIGGTVPFLGFLLVFSDGLCPGRSDCSECCVWDVCFLSAVELRKSPSSAGSHLRWPGDCDSSIVACGSIDVFILRLFFF